MLFVALLLVAFLFPGVPFLPFPAVPFVLGPVPELQPLVVAAAVEVIMPVVELPLPSVLTG